MEEKKWIKTEQMLENLKNDPNNEQEYTHYLGGILRSTHWLIYDSEKSLFGHSTNWLHYDWYTENRITGHLQRTLVDEGCVES